MACYFPVTAWRKAGALDRSTGKWPLTFKEKDGWKETEMQVPCGKCLGCRLDYARGWALRCMHEAKLHAHNCVITLTYDPEHLPLSGELDRREIQNWLKVLRSRVGSFRFFGCGEYGSKGDRPHYHIILFGYDFPDKVLKTIHLGSRQYDSQLLREIWQRGHVSVGDVTFKSAAYIARYCLKKLEKEESLHVVDEFTMMSLKPGIGADFVAKFGSDMLAIGACVVDGSMFKIPKFYESRFSPADLLELKLKRMEYVKKETQMRLYQMSEAKAASMSHFKRSFEE